MRRSSELRQLLMGMSTRRYLPARGTAGLARSFVSGKSRVPAPPPMMTATTSCGRTVVQGMGTPHRSGVSAPGAPKRELTVGQRGSAAHAVAPPGLDIAVAARDTRMAPAAARSAGRTGPAGRRGARRRSRGSAARRSWALVGRLVGRRGGVGLDRVEIVERVERRQVEAGQRLAREVRRVRQVGVGLRVRARGPAARSGSRPARARTCAARPGRGWCSPLPRRTGPGPPRARCGPARPRRRRAGARPARSPRCCRAAGRGGWTDRARSTRGCPRAGSGGAGAPGRSPPGWRRAAGRSARVRSRWPRRKSGLV